MDSLAAGLDQMKSRFFSKDKPNDLDRAALKNTLLMIAENARKYHVDAAASWQQKYWELESKYMVATDQPIPSLDALRIQEYDASEEHPMILEVMGEGSQSQISDKDSPHRAGGRGSFVRSEKSGSTLIIDELDSVRAQLRKCEEEKAELQTANALSHKALTAERKRAEEMQAELQEAKAEAAKLREQLANLPPQTEPANQQEDLQFASVAVAHSEEHNLVFSQVLHH